jgi:PhnB protein
MAQDAQSVEMAPGETFWAERFAMFTDRYGTPWMLSFEGDKAQG